MQPSPAAPRDSIEPFIDNLWYYDSIITPELGSHSTPSSESLTNFSEDLPVSTGGLSSPHIPLADAYFTNAFESRAPSHNASAISGTDDSQLQELHRVFAAMDKDHNGELSEDELRQWMRQLGLQYAGDGMIRMLTQKSQLIGSGSLNFSEFVLLNKFIDEESSTSQQSFADAHLDTLYECFQLFDKNNNGMISPGELRETLGNMGLLKNGKDADYVDMIRRADTDGDGQVSFSEFRRMMDGHAGDLQQPN